MRAFLDAEGGDWAMDEDRTRVFVSSLHRHATGNDLGRLFRQLAEVVEARAIQDRETGHPQGYGFVQLASREAAQAARGGLDGSLLDGRRLEVRPARPVTRVPDEATSEAGRGG
jgi:RNA recognition motif-containing protein